MIVNTQIVDNARAIEAVLQRCMGSWANGQLLVKTQPLADNAPGPDVLLKPGSFAVPIVNGSEENAGTVYVKRNPATWFPGTQGMNGTGGQWTITAAGTIVDVESLQGGEMPNQETGTLYRWDEPIPGIEEQSECATALSGANFASGRLMQIEQYRQLGSADATELFAGNVSTYPSAVLAWAGLAPSDGPMQSSPGPRTARTATQTMLYRNTWFLFVITSNLESKDTRVREGMRIVSDLLEVLADCQSARELRVSTAPGIEIMGAEPFKANPRVYIDLIKFATHTSLKRLPEPETFSPFLASRYVNQTPAQGSADPLALPDETTAVPPNAFLPNT